MNTTSQVVQYLEDNYIASQRSGKDKMIIEEEAKRFVTKGLVNVLKDIEVASMNIDQLLQMQSLSIDSLTSDVSLIRSRLHGMKSQHLNATLDEMKVPYSKRDPSASAQTNTNRLSVREVEVDYAHRTHDNNDEASQSARSTTITGSVGITEDEAPAAGLVSNQKRQKISMEERFVTIPLRYH